MKTVMALRHLRLDKPFISYLDGRSLATERFCVKHETFVLLRYDSFCSSMFFLRQFCLLV